MAIKVSPTGISHYLKCFNCGRMSVKLSYESDLDLEEEDLELELEDDKLSERDRSTHERQLESSLVAECSVCGWLEL